MLRFEHVELTPQLVCERQKLLEELMVGRDGMVHWLWRKLVVRRFAKAS